MPKNVTRSMQIVDCLKEDCLPVKDIFSICLNFKSGHECLHRKLQILDEVTLMYVLIARAYKLLKRLLRLC